MSDRSFDWLRILLLALAVAGLLLSNELVRMHAGEKVPDVLSWACGGAALNCDKVLQSGFSRIMIIPPRPVPLAAIGMGYFTFLGLWLLMIGRLPGRLHHAWAIPAVCGLFGLLGSVFMVWAMAKVLHAWCGLCLATHAINLPLVVGIWVLWLAGRRGAAVEPDEPAFAAAGAQLWKIPVLTIIAGLAVGLTQIRETQTIDAVKSLEAEAAALDHLAFNNAKKFDIPVTQDDPVLGPPSAPHTVVVFSDFQCPYCAKFAPLFHEVQKALSPAGDISKAPFRLVFKHYPLNLDCNPGRRAIMAGKLKTEHPYACDAAAAAEAARRLGGNDAFWKMHDLLYKNQDQLGEQPYKKYAAWIGLDPDAFEKLRQDPDLRKRIVADSDEGNRVGVRTTPSVFLDGRRIDRPICNVNPLQVQAQTVQHWKSLLLWASLPIHSSEPGAAFDDAIRQMQPIAPGALAPTSQPLAPRAPLAPMAPTPTTQQAPTP